MPMRAYHSRVSFIASRPARRRRHTPFSAAALMPAAPLPRRATSAQVIQLGLHTQPPAAAFDAAMPRSYSPEAMTDTRSPPADTTPAFATGEGRVGRAQAILRLAMTHGATVSRLVAVIRRFIGHAIPRRLLLLLTPLTARAHEHFCRCTTLTKSLSPTTLKSRGDAMLLIFTFFVATAARPAHAAVSVDAQLDGHGQHYARKPSRYHTPILPADIFGSLRPRMRAATTRKPFTGDGLRFCWPATAKLMAWPCRREQAFTP